VEKNQDKSFSYRDAGVDIEAGNQAVEEIKEVVKSTYRPEVLGDLGGFGGLFALNTQKYKEPVLVSGTDGVGTKLQIAFMTGKHNTIGQDAVAMCVNDILAQGAEPLFFLDYLAVGKLEPNQIKEIVSGVANACRESGCSLIGGETAEMAGFYKTDEYDIAGFCVGIVEKENFLPKKDIAIGDVVLGIPSSGIHSNGFSLVRKICFDHKKMAIDAWIPELESTLGEVLLTPTRLYPKLILPLLEKFKIKGLIHITGGGFYDNIPRILPEGLGVKITKSWKIPAIFSLLQEWGNVDEREMYRTFNMGIGMMLVLPKEDATKMIAEFKNKGEAIYEIGEVISGDRNVLIEGIDL
jgi:phosphoribosylaminoimidazole synthetase